MMTVLLRLEGPLQSWGSQGRFALRDTDRTPTRSGVLGLVACAMGIERDDSAALKKLRSLRMAVRVDRPGTLLRDYHTVGGGTFRSRPHRLYGADKKTAVTDRYFLQDASFLVGLEGNPPLVEAIGSALENPRWPLSLGRRSCTPARKIFAGLVSEDCEAAVTHAPLCDNRIDNEGQYSPTLLLVEADSFQGQPRTDVPESLLPNDRRFSRRFVKTKPFSRGDFEAS